VPKGLEKVILIHMSKDLLDQIKNGLIVSCQAPAASPLRGANLMKFMALAAESGGAAAIRAEGLADVREIKDAVNIPVIGLIKKIQDGTSVIITESIQDVADLIEAGADMVAVDATLRKRLNGKQGPEFISEIKKMGVPILADIDDFSSAKAAVEAGADSIATTLSGYTGGTIPESPDIELIRTCVKNLDIPVVAEGRFNTPNEVSEAFKAGAWSVCVGGAITDPWKSTIRFVKNMHK